MTDLLHNCLCMLCQQMSPCLQPASWRAASTSDTFEGMSNSSGRLFGRTLSPRGWRILEPSSIGDMTRAWNSSHGVTLLSVNIFSVADTERTTRTSIFKGSSCCRYSPRSSTCGSVQTLLVSKDRADHCADANVEVEIGSTTASGSESFLSVCSKRIQTIVGVERRLFSSECSGVSNPSTRESQNPLASPTPGIAQLCCLASVKSAAHLPVHVLADPSAQTARVGAPCRMERYLLRDSIELVISLQQAIGSVLDRSMAYCENLLLCSFR